MNAWDTLRAVAADRRSGASEISSRAASALARLDGRAEVVRAARRVLRSHPAMAQLWRAFALAYQGDDVEAFGEQIKAETDAIATVTAGWALPRRAVVLTHSASSSVLTSLVAGRSRIDRVICTASLPGGEGRPFAGRVRRLGLEVSVVADAEIAKAVASASVVLVGADALTQEAAVNKVGTTLVALAAREQGVPCYALAGTSKMIATAPWNDEAAPEYEPTPLRLFASILTEHGPRSPAAVRRAASRYRLPRVLVALAP